MGPVFKARQTRLNRIVALKVLKPTLARNAKFVDRLKREARIVASLNHPDIVAGYDLGEEGGYHFFVMEFVEGKSLATLLKEWGAFPQEQVLDVAIRVASALDHAFKKGVIHRDIKPGNILIDAEGRAKLTDMGLAKAPEDVTITQEGATVGTPQYISPEQARDPTKADVRSDLYSLGATMFHMCTGQPPFVGTTLANVIHEVIHRRAPTAAAINPAVSDGLGLVIKKLLAKDPALRYQTPAELLADLHRVRRAELPQIDAVLLERAEPSEVVRPRRSLVLAATAGVLALGVAAAVFWPRGRPPAVGRDDSTSAFTARVQANVTAAQGWRGKLRALLQAAGDAAHDDERRAVADLRAGLLISWQEALEQHVRARHAEVARFVLEPEHWRDPGRALRKNVSEGVERAFAISRAELPADLQRALDAELDQLDAEVASRVSERDQNLLAAFRTHIEVDVADAWRSALEQGDYVAADRIVRGVAHTFFGQAGRPRREQLGAPIAKEFMAVEERAQQSALQEIERAEARTAVDLARTAEEALAQMQQDLRSEVDLRTVQQRFANWRHELSERYPGSTAFRNGADPWPRVADLEQVFRGALTAARAAADERRLHADARLALGALLVDGDAAQELAWLRERDIEDAGVAERRERWAQLLGQAHAARDWVLLGLGPRVLAVSDAAMVDRTRQVSARRNGETLELVERDGQRARRVSLAALRVSELIDAVTPSGAAPSPAVDRGLALWLYCAGENSLAAKRLPADDRDFFGAHVADAVQAVLGQRRGSELEARETMARLRSAYRGMALPDLRIALDGFSARFGDTAVAAASVQLVADMRAHLRTQERQAAVLSDLRKTVPPALQVTVLDDGRVQVVCDPQAAGELPLAAGWSRGERALQFVSDDVTLDAVRAHALVLDDGLSNEHGIACNAQLEFAAQGKKPRLYLFEVHGAGVALGLTAMGEPFACVVALDDLGREKALQRDLEREIDALVEPRPGGPMVVPGARHTLSLEVRVQPERLLVRARFDGVQIASGNLKRPQKCLARVVVMPMQPLQVWRLAVEGEP
jgi:hypothetical protein